MKMSRGYFKYILSAHLYLQWGSETRQVKDIVWESRLRILLLEANEKC